MSESAAVPRILIRKSKGSSSLQINFEFSRKGASENEETVVDRLIKLADDWTSFCISGMQYTPTMTQAGYFWLEHTVDEEIITFLNEVSISKEVNNADDDSISYSYILHEEDLSQVANKLATTTQMMRAADAVKRSTLGSLVAEFDFFILRFLEICSEVIPEKFYDEGKTFSIRDYRSKGGLDGLVKGLWPIQLIRGCGKVTLTQLAGSFPPLDFPTMSLNIRKTRFSRSLSRFASVDMFLLTTVELSTRFTLINVVRLALI